MNSTTTAPARFARPAGGAGAIVCTWCVARRSLRRCVRTPHLFSIGVVRGAMFLLIFRYVFGGAVDGDVRYVDYLVPGFLAAGVLFSGMAAAAGVAEDMAGGWSDRLRSLPIPALPVLTGRVLADTVLAGASLAVTTVIGVLIGFRPAASAGALLGAVALCLLAAFAFGWVFTTVGLVAGSPQAAHGLALLVFPVAFVSSAFVPVDSMPYVMQLFADNQPLTQLANAVRAITLGDQAELALGHAPGSYVLRSILWSAGLTATFAVVASRIYQRDRAA